MQLYAPFCLLVDKFPISRSALRVLFLSGWVIERELDVMKSAQFIVFENSNTVTV